MSDAPILAWHFVADTLRDGRPVPPDGEWLVHDGPLVLCESGLHASRDVWHALRYAPGPFLCRVEMAGRVIEADDKLVAKRRRILARIDATDPLWTFSRQCALDVIHVWDAPDIVREYLETGREDIRDAARAAASSAACNAASNAAWNAASAAASAAASSAASAAASSAACNAARAAAWAAARAAASDAARAAALAAARDVSEQRQAARFRALVAAAFPPELQR